MLFLITLACLLVTEYRNTSDFKERELLEAFLSWGAWWERLVFQVFL